MRPDAKHKFSQRRLGFNLQKGQAEPVSPIQRLSLASQGSESSKFKNVCRTASALTPERMTPKPNYVLGFACPTLEGT